MSPGTFRSKVEDWQSDRFFVISYISWDLTFPVIRLITFRADIISARALVKLLQSSMSTSPSARKDREMSEIVIAARPLEQIVGHPTEVRLDTISPSTLKC